jgi:hypothetical protein
VFTPWTKRACFVEISPIVQPKAKQQKKTDAMNTKNKSYEPKYATKNRPAIKTVSLQVAVTRPDLQNTIRNAFDLAKSGGRELDLAFTLQPLTQSFPKPSNIRAAQLASF